MFFDPLYLAVMGIGLLLSLGAQAWVMGSVRRWREVAMGRGMTGRDIAQLILQSEGIHDVQIEEVQGFLSDHYDPTHKVLRLSPDNYRGRSVAAAGISAHEVGHAIQDKVGYAPMRIRQKLVPVANIGTNLGVILIMIGIAIRAVGMAKIGVLLFGAFVLFTLVTLPVEIDASRRAYATLSRGGILARDELGGVRQVLTAAAATYLAAAVTAILQLLYFAYRAGLLGGDNRRRD
jgi:Zn-dependent membrane protease YugP